MKYNKTKYPNIFWYVTLKGKRYYIRRGYYLNGEKKGGYGKWHKNDTRSSFVAS